MARQGWGRESGNCARRDCLGGALLRLEPRRPRRGAHGQPGVRHGPARPGLFLVTAGDNTDRIHSEAAFAKLCGVAPQPASSGRTSGRHRLSRGGDRAANSALYIVTIVRMRHHQPTRDYVDVALPKD